VALRQEVDGKWKQWTWTEYNESINAFAKSLISIGFERHASVNIIGFNSPEWYNKKTQ
jgi:long-chain-fatty-acid--CoA ligase ACSBG